MQTRTQSLIEQTVSTAIGFVVALVAQLAIFPLFGIHISMNQNLMLVVLFTGVSIVRGYMVRRLFNYWHGRSACPGTPSQK